MQIRMQIGMQQWQRQKVSDAEQRIENRLAELHRSDILNQSYTPNVGNLNESPTITGGHRGADSSAKLRQKVDLAMKTNKFCPKITFLGENIWVLVLFLLLLSCQTNKGNEILQSERSDKAAVKRWLVSREHSR